MRIIKQKDDCLLLEPDTVYALLTSYVFVLIVAVILCVILLTDWEFDV